MEIELKNIMLNFTYDGAQNVFYSTMCINGTNVGIAFDLYDSKGTTYIPFDEKGKELIQKAEVFYQSQPPVTYKLPDSEMVFDSSLKVQIAVLVAEYVKQEEINLMNAQIEEYMDECIVVGIPGDKFELYPLPEMLNMGIQQRSQYYWLKESLKQVQPFLTNGNKILNTNIDREVLELAGINKEQHVLPRRETPGFDIFQPLSKYR